MNWIVVVMICTSLECTYTHAEQHLVEQECNDAADEIYTVLVDTKRASEGIAVACVPRNAAIYAHKSVYDLMKSKAEAPND